MNATVFNKRPIEINNANNKFNFALCRPQYCQVTLITTAPVARNMQFIPHCK